MSYRIIIRKAAQKFISRQPATQAKRLYIAINNLSENPFPPGYKKLEGRENEYRIRVGSMRILYAVEANIITIFIFEIGYRGDIYK